MTTHRYNGELVLLGSRLTRLPNEKDLQMLKEEYRPFAATDQIMPKVHDVIVISSRGPVEWIVSHAGARQGSYNYRALVLSRVPGFERVEPYTDSLSVHIAYEKSALLAPSEAINVANVFHNEIKIVGQMQVVTKLVRLPSLPIEAVDALGLERVR